MKKGQTEQIFFYIFAIIVTAVILFLGMKAIGYTKTIGSQVELTNFITDIKSGAEKNFNLGLGSRTKTSLITLPNTNIICFLNPDETIDFSTIKNSKSRQIISKIYKLQDSNMYISIDNKFENYNIKNIKVKNGIQCKEEPFQGFTLLFENKGSYSELEIE